MNRKLTAEDIDKIEKRSELVKIIEKYGLNIECRLNRLEVIKDMIKAQLDVISKQQEESIKENITNPVDEKKEEEKKVEETTDSSIEKKENKDINLESLKIENTEDIDISDLVIYKNSDITKVNEFILETSIDLNKVVYLKNEQGELSGEMYIEVDEGKKYIVAPKEKINVNKLEHSNSCEVIFVDNKDITKGYSIKTSIEVRGLRVFEGTLCIDFGTSNTSVGTYLPETNEIKLIKFRDVLNNNIERETIPTVIYVENCKNINDIVYKFGYEAKKAIKDKDYNFKNTIFYEVKRWLLDIEKEEELIDRELNRVIIKRKDILRAYLEYLLKEASNQFQYRFKRLHFSTPISLKEKYISSIKNILTNYEVMDAEKSIDEGVAVIYDDIYKDVVNLKNRKEELNMANQARKVMTIDVGGGTTDVISSTFSLEDESQGTKLKIHTYPENSNSYFGGNNITYRIFQYLKIKIARYLENENLNIDIDDLIEMSKTAILEFIDDTDSSETKKSSSQKINEIYNNFEIEYKKASEILPTNYKTNNNFKTNKQKGLLKRNFYLLWEAAETIKIEFFNKTEIYLIDFISEDKESKKIKIPNIDNLLFSIVKDGNLETIKKVPQIAIGINEIQKLIYGDIYKLIKDILGEKTNIEDSYIKVKLSGQTCNIILFQELLKEFIAGRKLRGKSSANTENSNYATLKLNCIRGSIRYTSDIDTGVTIPEIYRGKAPLRHRVEIERAGKVEVLTKEKSLIQLFDIDASIIKMSIYDWENNHVKDEIYNLSSLKDGKELALREVIDRVSNQYAESIEEQLKTIAAEETKVVIFNPSNEADSLEVIELYKTKENKFILINRKKFSFEKDIDGSKFFNGEE